ncbi:MAG TPA: T9SS type A sorting domain-containing protein [Chitinophagaceae bacterium]
MKTFLPAIIALLSLSTSSIAQSPKSAVGTDAGWFSEAQSVIGKMEYEFRQTDPRSFACANRSQKVIYTIHSNGYSVAPGNFAGMPPAEWKTSFDVVAASKGAVAHRPDASPRYEAAAAHLLQHHDLFTIEYLNSAEGLRQNFIINRAPEGSQALKLTIALKNTGLHARLVNRQILKLADKNGKTILQYDALSVWDARHTPLPAHMELSDGGHLAIVVDDRGAQYPVTIDPLNHSAEWSGTAVGILPSLVGQLSVDAAYGYSVAGLGDVNGDGYDDVAIGAPGLVDIISGSGTLAGVGAVFVYYGKPGGLSATPDAKLQPSTAAAGALFGYSIAGGDINGDGKADVIVGAPMDKVSVSAGGSNTVSGKIGKVYVFSGASLTASTITPLLTLQLSGSGILETTNISANALFGFSVSVTDDLNKDGLKDIIVGAPTYAGIKNILGFKSLDVQSGAAFVFLSDNSGGFSTVKLNPPTSSLLGLGILNTNIGGLLFGISVDGAGDYNGDGLPDVVVGAPAGVNLGSLNGLLTGQLLQGSAMVYYGTGSGVQTQAGATLAASSGGLLTNLTGTLSNIVNLFGYCVKGVKDVNGNRTGNILVGAPLGGTLTNLLGGLQVKTGTVSVFVKKSSSPSGIVTPNQQLSSPRNSNTILGLIQSSLLFGFSIDNAYDMNCDGIPDIVIGEPASSGAQLIAANVTGGSAYVFTGNADGTYKATPAWTLGATYDSDLGVNVASLIGYSVAGAGKVKGSSGTNKVLAGAPGLTLDFGSGLLNLGSTLNTLFGLAAGNNGPGKSYEFDPALCLSGNGSQSSLPLNIINFNAVASDNSKVLVSWDVVTEKDINSYTIQRSTDGLNWGVFGILPGNPANSNEEHYSITDNHPFSGTSYYRILQLDIDNSSFYTGVKMVSINTTVAANMQVNNPFHQSISIRLTAPASGKLSTDLLDLTGKVLRHEESQANAGLNNITISGLSGLANGMYFIRVTSGGQQYSAKLIKE